MARDGVRILPLGGLGEIGKNMTVFERSGRIVVVDTGLMFPTAEMAGQIPSARMRLPMVEADERVRTQLRKALEAQGLLTASAA